MYVSIGRGREHGIFRKREALSPGPWVSRQLQEQPLTARLLAASASLTPLVPRSEAEPTYSVKQILVLPRGSQSRLLSVPASFLATDVSAK